MNRYVKIGGKLSSQIAATLLLSLIDCGQRATPAVSAERRAAQVALTTARAGVPYLRLDGEPTEMRGSCTPSPGAVCTIVIFGHVLNTIPAAPGVAPERTEILPRWQFHIDGERFTVLDSSAYADGQAPDASGLPPITLGP